MSDAPRPLFASPQAPRLLALVAGALFPLALAPFGWSTLGVLSMALLCALLRNGGPREVFVRALAFGLGQFGVGASWVYVSIHVYGEAPAPLATLLTGLFILLLALCLAVPFSLYGRMARRPPLAALFLFPSLWVVAEWFRGWFLTGFPWLYLGNSQIDGWLAGWAPIGGVLTLSWMLAFSGAALAQLAQLRDSPPGVIAGLLLTALLWLWGDTLDDRHWTTPADSPVRVALLQPALPLNQKWDQNALFQILDLYRRETESLWRNPLVIWPESAIPEVQHRVDHYLGWMDERAREAGSTLITGVPIQAGNRYYNSVIALGDGSGRYDKRHLVPFGEYVPLERWLRGTIRFFDLPMSTFSNGADRQPLLRAGDLRIATAICYEIVYQDLVAGTTADADILLTVSNDTWFGSSIGPHQHFEMARMRALENGKPVLRGTNDGITAIIDSRGKVQAALPQFQRAVLEGEVTPHSGTTPFTRFGSWPVVVLCLLVVAAGLWLGRTGLIAGRLASDV